jgi:cytochrome P450
MFMETDTPVFYAHFSTLTFGATDTTSTIIARIIYLLAQHSDVQDRVRNEVREARANGDLDYNQLSALPYLDAIVRESLRL